MCVDEEEQAKRTSLLITSAGEEEGPRNSCLQTENAATKRFVKAVTNIDQFGPLIFVISANMPVAMVVHHYFFA